MLLLSRRALIGSVIVVGGSIWRGGVVQAEDFTLTIARKYSDAHCTSGYLAVTDKLSRTPLSCPGGVTLRSSAQSRLALTLDSCGMITPTIGVLN